MVITNTFLHMAIEQNIGIIGGGPAGLFIMKRLVEHGNASTTITIFERKNKLGAGMPYSYEGACVEHITNVSGNEIPDIRTGLQEWINTAPQAQLRPYHIIPENFNDYKVVPRLLFGEYLSAQFQLLIKEAKAIGMSVKVFTNTSVTDIEYHEATNTVSVIIEGGKTFTFNTIVISTGHYWPKVQEGKIPGWYDSPYPPQKLARQVNYPVAIKGASLSAIDAVRTLARSNGYFDEDKDGRLTYHLHQNSAQFKMVMHSLNGLLPAIRFHLEDSHLAKDSLLRDEDVRAIMDNNNGFIPLDFIFEVNFKEPLRKQAPDFYEKIKWMDLETFVEHMMSLRERLDAFTLFKAEYAEAEQSIKREQSVHWKEMLAVLSFSMNYPAKHLSAEDMMRLKKVLMPLISIVIAFVPQSSCRELIALKQADVLRLVPVANDSKAEPQSGGGALCTYTNEAGKKERVAYRMFVNATGQPPFTIEDFPFQGLLKTGTISRAMLRFRSREAGEKALVEKTAQVKKDTAGNYYLQVPGIQINDHFQVLDKYGAANTHIYIMAVPYIAGLNPDYSGLDFCEEASKRIMKAIAATAGQVNHALTG